MPVKEKKKVFESHGREFDTVGEAEKYDALQTAREAHEAAREKFQRLLAENQKTADGETFDLGSYGSYYFIRTPFHVLPSVITVRFIGWNFTLREDEYGVSMRDDGHERDNHFYPIAQLYASERHAEKALMGEQAKWLAERVKEMNVLRRRVNRADLVVIDGPVTE